MLVKQVDPEEKQVSFLVEKLNDYLNQLYREDENHLDSIQQLAKENAYMAGIFVGDVLVGIGALKLIGSYCELKRMFVEPSHRGKGMSRKLLEHLELKAKEYGAESVKLETGNLQKEAIGLYENFGYKQIEPFGEYHPNDSSLFFEKKFY